MSDKVSTPPDEELLEFLGDLDEIEDVSKEDDFADFLANTDVDRAAGRPRESTEEGKRE